MRRSLRLASLLGPGSPQRHVRLLAERHPDTLAAPAHTDLAAVPRLVLSQPSDDFRILAGPPLELEHSDNLFLFAALYHRTCFLEVTRERVACFDGRSRDLRREPQRFTRPSGA